MEAERFARLVYEDHQHLGIFTVEVDSKMIDRVTIALQNMGCLIYREEFTNVLWVSCDGRNPEDFYNSSFCNWNS